MNFSVVEPPTKLNITQNKLPKSAGVSSRARGGKKKKIKLGHGFSQMDWIRLNNRATDMAGLGGKSPAPVSRAELRQHRSQYDCWMVLHGKVYNVTKYVPYHPGVFDEVMRGAGIDATKLFDDNHAWVSIEGFLEKCFVGDFVDEGKEGVSTEVGKKDESNKDSDGEGEGGGEGGGGEGGGEGGGDGGGGGMSWGDLDDML